MSKKPEPLWLAIALIFLSTPSLAMAAEEKTHPGESAATAEQIELWRESGIRYYEGSQNFFRQDYTKAREFFEKAAEAGDPTALYYLGSIYNDAKGVDKDEDKARALFSEAAKGGQPDAQMFTAVFLIMDGIIARTEKERDELYAQAVPLLQKSYAQGNMEAAFWLGDMIQKGLGIAQNEEKGRAMIRESAESGNPNAEAMLGMYYLLGSNGVEKDLMQAHKWMSRSIHHNNSSALIQLRRIERQMSAEQKKEAQAAALADAQANRKAKESSTQKSAPAP